MGQASASGSRPSGSLNDLTEKQRQVLNLLIQHKTSKEISRVLGISPHTVDQRIDLAKSKWGLGSRSELAQTYRQLVEAAGSAYERVTYEEFPVAEIPHDADERSRNESGLDVLPEGPDRNETPTRDTPVEHPRVVPELFDGQWGTLARLGAIVGIALLIMLALLAGLSVFVSVSEVFTKAS